MSVLGQPHLHYRSIDSTNDRARELGARGAPHGTIVTADEQTAGRGRRGRSWQTPPGQALLMSVVLREVPELLTLRAGLAVATACEDDAELKWPNDVLSGDRKVAGILCERAAGESWAVAGIGVNVAVDLERLTPELRYSAGTLGLAPAAIGPWRERLLAELQRALEIDDEQLLTEWSGRDHLRGREVRWDGGTGVAAGLDVKGRLLVEVADAPGGALIALDSGEVSLARLP